MGSVTIKLGGRIKGSGESGPSITPSHLVASVSALPVQVHPYCREGNEGPDRERNLAKVTWMLGTTGT